MTFNLIYHDMAPPGDEHHYGFLGAAAARYKLTPERFEAHLDSIRAAHVEVGLAADHPQAALTFDDGGASALWLADARGHGLARGSLSVAGEAKSAPKRLSPAAYELIRQRSARRAS